MTQNILTAGNATSSLSTAAGDDGTFKIVVGPNGSQVDGLAIGATGNAAVAGTLTQAGIATPRIVLATAQNTTSGTSIDFNSIPSWVKKITVMLNTVSTTGTSIVEVRLGSGSIAATGYLSSAMGGVPANTFSGATSSSGFLLTASQVAANTFQAMLTICHMGGNTWSASGVQCVTGGSTLGYMIAGMVQLGGVLDRLRLTTQNGTDTFDSGSVNILYEG